MIFRHLQEYIKLENCRFSKWTIKESFRTVRWNVEDSLSYRRRQCKYTTAMTSMGWALERLLPWQTASFSQTSYSDWWAVTTACAVADRKPGSTQQPSTQGEADVFYLRTVRAAQQRKDSVSIPFLPYCTHFKSKNMAENTSDRDRQIHRAKEGYENDLNTSQK